MVIKGSYSFLARLDHDEFLRHPYPSRGPNLGSWDRNDRKYRHYNNLWGRIWTKCNKTLKRNIGKPSDVVYSYLHNLYHKDSVERLIIKDVLERLSLEQNRRSRRCRVGYYTDGNNILHYKGWKRPKSTKSFTVSKDKLQVMKLNKRETKKHYSGDHLKEYWDDYLKSEKLKYNDKKNLCDKSVTRIYSLE